MKNPFDKEIKIIDAENRIIKIDNNLFDDLDLFDLILITNCKIKKSIKDKYTYDLELTENSIKYFTKNLFFDKRISLNNYTILDIKINDFKEGNNIFNDRFVLAVKIPKDICSILFFVEDPLPDDLRNICAGQ